MMRLVPLFAILLVSLATNNAAAGEFRLPFCSTQKLSGWSYYCREPEPEPEPEPQEVMAPPPAPTSPKKEEPEQGEATKAIMEFRAQVDELKYRAVLDPTRENVEAYIRIQQAIADQAGAFTDQWQRVLFETPELDPNTKYPLTQAGIGVYQDQMRIARESNLKNVANNSGLMFIFEDSATCGMCRVQGEVLDQVASIYGVNVLAVSKDGGANEHFPNAYKDGGRLEELGLAEFPAPTLALIDPKTQEVKVIGSGLLTADQIMERVYVITQIPVGERY